jgi:hypothetical protein
VGPGIEVVQALFMLLRRIDRLSCGGIPLSELTVGMLKVVVRADCVAGSKVFSNLQ